MRGWITAGCRHCARKYRVLLTHVGAVRARRPSVASGRATGVAPPVAAIVRAVGEPRLTQPRCRSRLRALESGCGSIPSDLDTPDDVANQTWYRRVEAIDIRTDSRLGPDVGPTP